MDANALVMDIIRRAHPGLRVSTELPPDENRGPYVMVYRTGGPDGEFLDSPIMTLMCWDRTDPEALSLAASCRDAIGEAAQDHPLLSSASVVALSRDQWTRTGAARYMLEIQLTVNKE